MSHEPIPALYNASATSWKLYEFCTNEGDLICSGTLDYCIYRAAALILERGWMDISFLTPAKLISWQRKCLQDGYTWCDPKHEYWYISSCEEHSTS